jgi:hypothetical protein
VCLKVGLVVAGEDLTSVRQVMEEWSKTTRRVRLDWDDKPVEAEFGQALPESGEHLALHLGDRETGCSCGLATNAQNPGWRRSAMSDLSYLLQQLTHQPVKALRLGIVWEGEEAQVQRLPLSLPQFRRLVKRGALVRNHLYAIDRT